MSATVEERIKALDEIRTVTRQLIDIQTEGCSEQLKADFERQKMIKELDRCVSVGIATNIS